MDWTERSNATSSWKGAAGGVPDFPAAGRRARRRGDHSAETRQRITHGGNGRSDFYRGCTRRVSGCRLPVAEVMRSSIARTHAEILPRSVRGVGSLDGAAVPLVRQFPKSAAHHSVNQRHSHRKAGIWCRSSAPIRRSSLGAIAWRRWVRDRCLFRDMPPHFLAGARGSSASRNSSGTTYSPDIQRRALRELGVTGPSLKEARDGVGASGRATGSNGKSAAERCAAGTADAKPNSGSSV